MTFNRSPSSKFEGIAKTNTTHTTDPYYGVEIKFEGIAKTNTTHTPSFLSTIRSGLRVLLKQILPTQLEEYS